MEDWLADEDAELADMRVDLASLLLRRRRMLGYTQSDVALLIGSLVSIRMVSAFAPLMRP